MQKLIWSILILAAASSAAFAGPPITTPEIDANTSLAAVGLLAGAVLVIRGRKK